MKTACFYDFLRKNQFLPIFYTQNDNFSNFQGVLTSWRHIDVIHKWLVLILVSMKRRCPYLYTGSKFRVMTFSINNPAGGCNIPLSEKYVWEKPSGEQGLISILPFFLFTAVIYQFSTNWCYKAVLWWLFWLKKRPHTSFSAPCHEVNGHDVYLVMNRNDFSVSKEAIFNSKLSIVHFPKFGRKAPPTSNFYGIYTLFEPFVLPKHHNE